jgi:hypothetical protein
MLPSNPYTSALRTAPELINGSVSTEEGERVKTSALSRLLGIGFVCRMS